MATSSWECEAKTSHPGIWQEALETPTLAANKELYQRWQRERESSVLTIYWSESTVSS